MLLSEAIQEYLAEHQSRGSRPKTIVYYQRTLARLLPEDLLTQPVENLTVFIVNKCLTTAAGRGISPATLASYDRALRGFTSWLTGVELISRDPMKNRKRPSVRWKPKQVLSNEETAAIFAVIQKDKRYAARNLAILHLLLGCGLRAGEVANLKLTDIDWHSGIIEVTGKVGYGKVPATQGTMQALRRYVTHHRKAMPSVTPVFLYDGHGMTSAGVSRLVTRIAKRAGIERHVGSHLLRHTMASRFIEGGGDPFSLKRILRHTSLYTSSLYVSNSVGDLRDKLEAYGPQIPKMKK